MHLLYSQNPDEPASHPLLRDAQSAEIYAQELGLAITDWSETPIKPTVAAQNIVLSDRVGEATDDPDEDAQSWLRSWSQSGWERFDSAYRQAKAHAQTMGVGLLVRPSSQGMLSDAVCTLNWCARGAGQDATLLLDPLGWVVASMLRDVDDHLDRICELCVEMCAHDRVGCVLVRSIHQDPQEQSIRGVSLEHGSVDAGLIVDRLGPLIECAPNIAVLDGQDLGRLA